MKKSLPLLLLLSLLLSSCKKEPEADNRPMLAVTIAPAGFVVEQIAGSDFRVHTLMPVGASPETYEPTPRQMAELKESKILFCIGTLGFEQTRLPRLTANMPDLSIVSLSEGIEPIAASPDGDASSTADPHVWTSPAELVHMAENVCRALCDTDPDNTMEYQRRLYAFRKSMESIDRRCAHILSQLHGRTFLIHHPALGYYARHYGLRQVAVEHDGKDPSAARIARLTAQARTDSVHLVFISKEHTGRASHRIAEDAGLKVVTINPLSTCPHEELLRITEELYTAEKGFAPAPCRPLHFRR